ELRSLFADASIGVFNGLLPGEEKHYLHYRLTPVINDLAQMARWDKAAGTGTPAILHVDTGMTRLGLSMEELNYLVTQRRESLRHLVYVISHLACANDPADPKNAEQLQRFRAALELLPGLRASLSNSSGLFL